MKIITIGRNRECDIVIPDDNVSRIHARISRNGNEFIYHDISRNGSSIGGLMIRNERVAIAPGTAVLLANRIPLPWEQVYLMLPGHGNIPQQSLHVDNDNVPYMRHKTDCGQEDKLGIGWGILAFLIPLAGWIMYFAWKEKTPKRASLAGVIGIISFVINLISIIGV